MRGRLNWVPAPETSLLSEGANIESGQITFDYSGADPAASVHQALLSHQIYSSTADADYSSTLRASCALGWIDNGPVGGLDNVVVKYTLVGDANCDGQVNGTDLDLLRRIGEPAPPPGPRAISTTATPFRAKTPVPLVPGTSPS